MTGLRPLSDITSIVVHCSDTPNGDPRYGAREIDWWHLDNGWRRPGGWEQRSFAAGVPEAAILRACGYHYVIEVDGTVVPGRALGEVGAHCPARNRDSIGICLVGRAKFTAAQWDALRGLVCERLADMERWSGVGLVSGHRDNIRPGRDQPKVCPGFDAKAWIANGMRPLEEHICEPKEKTHG